jgi:hypothetical protein
VEVTTKAYDEAIELPLLAADLTFARIRHGRVYSAMSDWEEDREPVVGETVLVADGEGQPLEARTIVLTVLAFAA